jgi:3-oxoacyl-[acyl-carrier protein] reductase
MSADNVSKIVAEDLLGKVAIVTGSARGIGKAIAIGLARRGADLVITDIDEDGCKATAAEIAAIGRRTLAIRCNVTKRDEMTDLVKQTISELGSLDIFVNNAGITRDGLLIRMSDEQWDMVIDINLKGCFLGCQAAGKAMMKARAGKIVNVASIMGLVGNAGQANYSASKGGVIALTRAVAKELASRNINVNAIAPGFIETEMTESMADKAKEAFLEMVPLKRTGKPEDVANLVCFLCSADSDYLTGQCITIDGGLTIN